MKNNKVMLAINAYFYGVMIGSMFTWFHVIGIAAQQDWGIFMDFNKYGEGIWEYGMMTLWLVVAVIKFFIWVAEQVEKADEKVEL